MSARMCAICCRAANVDNPAHVVYGAVCAAIRKAVRLTLARVTKAPVNASNPQRPTACEPLLGPRVDRTIAAPDEMTRRRFQLRRNLGGRDEQLSLGFPTVKTPTRALIPGPPNWMPITPKTGSWLQPTHTRCAVALIRRGRDSATKSERGALCRHV
jgi:hypothetical protein